MEQVVGLSRKQEGYAFAFNPASVSFLLLIFRLGHVKIDLFY